MQEIRLIDANALAESDMAKLIDKYLYNQCNLTVGLASALMPEIEAEPVRHGRMIEGRYPNENKCSECGQEFRDDIGFIIQDDDGVFHNPARCPKCGCYWDGGADKEAVRDNGQGL